MHIEDEKLKEILLNGSYLSEEDITTAWADAAQNKTPFADHLLGKNLITNDLLGQAIAESFPAPYSDLNSNGPSKEQVQKIPEELARKFRCVLFSIDEAQRTVTVTTDDPAQKDLQGELAKVFAGFKITITYSLPEDIDVNLIYYQKALDTRFSKIIETNKRIAPELLEEIFDDALTYNASDIHFEPQGEHVLIRFRVDGLLQEAGSVPTAYYENILNRVKVQSRLRIDEHYKAQDGSLQYEKDGRVTDMRTSIVPTVEGEKIVLRVLASYVQGLSLTDLGLSPRDQDLLKEMSEKPFGMILVTGPTGSGKTTTLYALLKVLNRPDVNITTIEDPVEYKIRGVNQIQVNVPADLTFANGLRSIVRQDPDIILVGEVRDTETAEISVNAALTGHLLFSTFHANDAATAVPRLLEMGIEPFLLASTLQIVIAQRLARKICVHCRYSFEVDPKSLTGKSRAAAEQWGNGIITLYQGKGCDACGHSGYKGRTALFEMMVMTPQIQDLILAHASSQQLWAAAQAEGTHSMFDDGLEKVLAGVTTLDELLRVIEPPKSATKTTVEMPVTKVSKKKHKDSEKTTPEEPKSIEEEKSDSEHVEEK